MSMINRDNLMPLITELNAKSVADVDKEIATVAESNPYWNMLGIKIVEFLRMDESEFDRKLFERLFLVVTRLIVGDTEYPAALLDRFVSVQEENNKLLEDLKNMKSEDEVARFFENMIKSHPENYFLDFAFVVAFQYTKRDEYRLMFFFAVKMLVDALTVN
jgi:hypothetical protein